ncbi:MAG TPA: hypothetical protein DCZ40_10415 [Lachnospiraceae bacterium]|nr:hypothetical protein [Lachnospiraceae bacterium]
MVEAVKIIHDELEGGEYRFLADYFRLAGIYVSECTLKSNEKKGEFAAVIIIDARLNEEQKEKFRQQYQNVVEIAAWGTEGNDNRLEYLENVLDRLENINPEVWKEEKEALNEVAEIYVNHKLLYYRHIYSYFYEKTELVQEAQDKFVDAYLALSDKIDKSQQSSVHLIYAKMMIARFINETCYFLKQRFLFHTGKCLKALDDILKEEPLFSNVYLLKAMFAEIDDYFKDQSAAYYKLATENLPELYYAYYPLYRFGRYYEKVLGDDETARSYYEKVLDLNEREYRVVYKFILSAKREGKYQEAIEYCKKICNILNTKKDNNYLQPREYEYLFKAYLEMTKIYRNHLTNGQELNEATKKRDSVCLKEENGQFVENRMYQQIFGSGEEQKFLELTAERLNTTVAVCEQ